MVLTQVNEISFIKLLIIILSVYVLIALLIDTFFKLPFEVLNHLNVIDNVICVIFLMDFSVNFCNAENKFSFMKWGWIDLISSIPTLDFMRAGRLLRLIRLIRILRAFRSTKHIVKYIFREKIQGTFTSISIVAILMVIFSSIAILQVEDDPNSNIKTAGDALWWAYVTITTVGYGDKFPVTTFGRIIAAALITVGVGLFGTFTGFLASWFVESKSVEEDKKSV
ncbi:MAG: potassium channel family protein [Bacteroidia bacterium]|nr:potassium channel family protein [Bacteroidia bacterium]